MSKLARLLALPWHERCYAVSALAVLPMLRFALRVWGFQRTHAMLQQFGPRLGDQPPSATANEIARIARIVNVAATYGLVRANCLPRSLAVWWLLHQQGVVSELRIGVRRQGDQFQAHAWVEREGVVVNDRSDVHFQFAAFDRVLG